MLEIPGYLQHDDFSCGTACFRCVVGYWETRGRAPIPHPLYGTPVDNLEFAFRNAGLSVLAGDMTVSVMRRLVGLGLPVVTLIQSGGIGHWVVVRGVTRSRVHFHDPAEGRRSLGIGEWEVAWFDSDRRTHYPRYGMAIGPS